MDYLLVRNRAIKQTITRDTGDVTAMPLIDGVSTLIDQRHVDRLLTWLRNNGHSRAEMADALAALGWTDERLTR